jgi:hypothetical protein
MAETEKATSQTACQDPAQQVLAGRTTRGTFAPGHSGNPKGGRRRLDFFSAAAVWAEAAGTTVEKALAQVIGATIEQAKAGDVAAQRLVIERFCGKETDVLELHDPDAVIDKDAALKELVSILSTAAAARN